MTYDIYRVFEIDMTEKEYGIIKKFCQAVDDYMDYVENFQTIYELIANIAGNRDFDNNIKINIIKEEDE